MSGRSTRLRGMGLATLWLCLLSGCGEDQLPKPLPRPIVGTGLAAEQRLTRSLGDAPRSLDPALADDVESQMLLDDLFEGLVRPNMDGDPEPGAASSWTSTADGKVWTFHLRPGLRWSNGASLTAEDFVYAWRRAATPATGSSYADSFAILVNGREVSSGTKPPETLGVRAVDANTLELTLVHPVPYLLKLLDMATFDPVYKPVVEKYGDTWTLPEHIVSNGAFTLQENVTNARLTLHKAQFYWDAGKVILNDVVCFVLPDSAAQQTRFLSGDIAWVDAFPASHVDWLRAALGDQVVTAPFLGTNMLTFDFTKPPFNNADARRALVLALDLNTIVPALKYQLNSPAYGLTPPIPGYSPPTPPWKMLVDPERHRLALAYYNRAGYSKAHPLRVDLTTPIQGTDERHFIEALASNWGQILGAEIRIQEIEYRVLAQERALHKLALNQGNWIGDFADPMNFLQLFRSGNTNNWSGYSNAEFDGYFDRANQAGKPEERLTLLNKAEGVLLQQAAFVPLYHYSSRHLVKPYIRGWQRNVLDRHPSRTMFILTHQSE